MNNTVHSVLKTAGVCLAVMTLAASAALPFTLRFAADGDLVIPFDPAEPEFAYQIGYRNDASVGYDAYDIPVPTTVPIQPGAIIFYMTASDPSIGGYSQDFRPVTDSQAWELNLRGMTAGSSVTLQWRLEDGDLDGNTLKLYDRATDTLVVDDMTATTSITLTNEDQELLLLYGDPNHPPVAIGDEVYMLQSDNSIAIPVETILANDYDPNLGDSISFVEVGVPQLILDGTKAGTSDYGTTTYDDVNEEIIYSLPDPLPGDWDGTVAFEYTVADDYFLDPLQSTATILVHVAPHVVQDPVPPVKTVLPDSTITFTYVLRYDGSLHSLKLRYTMPLLGVSRTPTHWLYADNYSDDATTTADPTIDTGAGPDGILGTADDTGLVVFDFDTNVPPSGTTLSFDVTLPADAVDASFESSARYRVTGTEENPLQQRLEPVDVRVLSDVLFIAERDLPACTEADQTVGVDILVTKTGTDEATSFSITETLPAGWEFETVTSTPAPDTSPAVGSTGELTFIWTTIPAFPLTLSYDATVPAAATGAVTFDGHLSYATTGDDIQVPVIGDTAMQVGGCCQPHDADQDGNWEISIAPEITRIIQFYNSGGYHCEAGTEDGYGPGPGDQTCDPHDADQNGNWEISIAPEITRIIQFYSSGGYQCQEGTEDGYAPGKDARKSTTILSTAKSDTDITSNTSAEQQDETIQANAWARNLANQIPDGSDRLMASSLFSQLSNAPAGAVDVIVTIDHVDPAALTALMVVETLPDGWRFDGVVSASTEPYVVPEANAQEELLFGWIDLPQEWPVTMTIRLKIPQNAVLPDTIAGDVVFREQAGARRVKLPDLIVTP